MLSIYFESNGKLKESLISLNQSLINVKNFVMQNNDVSHICILNNFNNHFSGEIILKDNQIFVGRYETVEKFINESGNFDLKFYESSTEEYDEETTFKINKNLSHIYNGGSDETVPYPMPYNKSEYKIEQIFKINSKVIPDSIYNREQILAMDFEDE